MQEKSKPLFHSNLRRLARTFLNVSASVVAMIATNSMAQAQGGAFVPEQNASMPYYFSGTNARAYGELKLLPQPQGFNQPYSLAWSKFYIGGHLVDEWFWTPNPDVLVSNKVVRYMFDSTQFTHGQPLEIKIEGGDTAGQYYMANGSTTVQNIARIWQNPDFDESAATSAADVVELKLPPLGIHPIRYYGNIEEEYFLARVKDSIIYVVQHGDKWHHALGTTTFPVILDSNYYDARQILNGSGFPPYNSSLMPPVNVLFAEWCEGGKRPPPSFDKALSPYRNSYGNTIENQAVIANAVCISTISLSARAHKFFEFISEGSTVLQTVDEMVKYANNLPGSLQILCQDEQTGVPRPQNRPEDYTIYGDTSTRIKTVYTGDQGNSVGWYRKL